MGTSKLQRRTSLELSKHFGGYIIRENIRPEWMIDETGQRLELDFWIEELDVAIEVQGNQHYEYVPHFHGSYDEYLSQKQRDEDKRLACHRRGILLFEVFDRASLKEAIFGIAFIAKQSISDPEYPPLDHEIKIAWAELLMKSRRKRKQNGNPADPMKSCRQKLIDLVSSNATHLLEIRPEIAKALIDCLLASEDIIAEIDKSYREKMFQRYYRRWTSGHLQKGGIRPPVEEYLKWLDKNPYNDGVKFRP
jgi:hypothetical protein